MVVATVEPISLNATGDGDLGYHRVCTPLESSARERKHGSHCGANPTFIVRRLVSSASEGSGLEDSYLQ